MTPRTRTRRLTPEEEAIADPDEEEEDEIDDTLPADLWFRGRGGRTIRPACPRQFAEGAIHAVGRGGHWGPPGRQAAALPLARADTGVRPYPPRGQSSEVQSAVSSSRWTLPGPRG